MKRTARTFAKQGVRLLESALQKTPPPGVRAEDVASFFAQNRAQFTAALAAQLAGSASAVPHGPQASLEVLIHAVPNPDFARGPEAVAAIPRRWVRVRSLVETIERVRAFIAEYDLGGGNWIGGHVRAGSRIVARVSYNGRLWQTDEAGRQTGYELSPEGAVLEYHGAVDETAAACGCSHTPKGKGLPRSPSKALPAARGKKR